MTLYKTDFQKCFNLKCFENKKEENGAISTYILRGKTQPNYHSDKNNTTQMLLYNVYHPGFPLPLCN